MAKKQVTKGVEDFNVEIAYNGFVVGYSGRTEDDEYEHLKVVVTTEEELFSVIKEILEMS